MIAPGEPAARAPKGLVPSLSALAAAALALVQARLELIGFEVEEARSRVVRMLVFVVVGTVFACFALIALSATIVVALWDEHRVGALFGIVAVYGIVALVALFVLKREARGFERPFTATLAELERDIAMLRKKP